MANDLTQNPLKFDTTVTDVPIPGVIYGAKLVANGGNATVVVTDHTTGHVIYQAACLANTSGNLDVIQWHKRLDHTIDVTITNGILLLYPDPVRS